MHTMADHRFLSHSFHSSRYCCAHLDMTHAWTHAHSTYKHLPAIYVYFQYNHTNDKRRFRKESPIDVKEHTYFCMWNQFFCNNTFILWNSVFCTLLYFKSRISRVEAFVIFTSSFLYCKLCSLLDNSNESKSLLI